MIKPTIFVSSPYTHADPAITEQRVRDVTAFVHNRLLAGEMAISPIVYGHSIVVLHELPGTYEFWESFCLSLLHPADKMYVLCLPGWDVSTGMKGELEFALEMQMEIEYVVPTSDAEVPYQYSTEPPML